MPDIGLRAVQGHSFRSDIGLEYLIAAQEKLRAEQEELPFLCVYGTDHTAWQSIEQTHTLIPGGIAGSRVAVHFAVSLLGDHGRIVSGFRTNSVMYMVFNLKQRLRRGRDAYRSANNVICVYEAVPLYYIHNVIDRHADKQVLADDDWHWLKSVVQTNNKEVTSAGSWQYPQESMTQIALTPQGNVRLLSRERETPSDRGVVQFDIFKGHFNGD